mgnify:CR=1 FL=1
MIQELLEWFFGDIVDELATREQVEHAPKIIDECTTADHQLMTFEKTGDLKTVVDQLVRETAEGVVGQVSAVDA